MEQIEKECEKEDFWQDSIMAQQKVKELSLLKRKVEGWESLRERVTELLQLYEIVEEEQEEQMLSQIEEELHALEAEVKRAEVEALLNGEYDTKNAILSIHPGAGGTESCDWASMLLRMYLRWAERRGFQTEILNLQVGDEAGIKDATIFVKGEYAYGYLKAEQGVHRLVRVSPFDASGRRHTSFASVWVVPEVDPVQVQIKAEELKVETFRAGGPGGQHVNVTDSAVRITHIPTGIVVSCQSERSQHKNKQNAMKVLCARVFDYYQRQQKEKIESLGKKTKIEWGNQIRSYVFFPYTMVKDHRTGFQTSDKDSVLDGKIDEFIEAYLFSQR